MAQSTRLVMIGLGMEADAPAVPIQPPLANGVHLRWSFRRNLGFPWWGYFLFRRPSDEGRLVCLSTDLRERGQPELGTAVLSLGVGTLSSDRPLRLIDVFPAAGSPEVDLSGGRSWLRFTLPAGDTANRVEARIGFHDIWDQHLDCIDLQQIVEAPAENPVRIGAFFIEVDPVAGRPLGPVRPILRREGDKVVGGLDAGRESVIHLDSAADEVTILVAHAGSGVRATAVNTNGDAVANVRARANGAVGTHELVLRSERAPISRVVLRTARGQTALLRVCRGSRRRAAATLRVVGAYGGVPMVTRVVSGNPSDVVPVSLEADAINEIAILPNEGTELPQAALVELCYHSAVRETRRGWEPVPDCPQPITLPLFHPDYPATGGSAVDVPAAEAIAMGRVSYGNPAPYAGAPFAELHTALVELLTGGPGGPPMADPGRASDHPGVGGVGGATPPKLTATHPLDLVLIAAIHPAAAQMLGLFWVDRTAVPGRAYDYLVIGDGSGAAGANSIAALNLWLGGAPNYEGFIVWNKRAVPAAPLLPPDGPRAYSLPLGAAVAPGGAGQPALDVAGLVGLHWPLPFDASALLPGSAVAYHLWREFLGNGTNPSVSGGLGDWLTTTGPILVAQPISDPFSTPQRPPDWPSFPMRRIDRAEAEGWYGYKLSGMDLFGRISPPSSPFPWHQWAPPPSPRPWYYTDPPSDAAVHPAAVRVLDKIPPPPPVGVEAAVLDPEDPYVTADAAYLAWRANLPAAVRDTLVGLRVRWRWTASQMRQAPHTAEFRLYYNSGGGLPSLDPRSALSWAERIHVVLYAAATSVAADGSERVYEVFLPEADGAVFVAGVPLQPTLADPIAYAYVDVSAADAAAHTPDDPRWATGAWGNRAGNEGQLGVPAKIARVLREIPDPPAPPPDDERVFATPADYHSRSYYTYRWAAAPNLKAHIFRAMDNSVFAVDRSHRPRPALATGSPGVFPNELRWDAPKREQVATELNGLNDFLMTPAGEAAARAAYRALSNDGLRILAGLSGNEAAFTQVTTQPLDPSDPATSNRVGPDNPPMFPVDPALRAYVDTLDGRGTNRYFYRAAYVDGAHNRSGLSLSGPPVWLPDVLPPRAPVFTKILGGDLQITLRWASNREADLAAYRIYRTDKPEAARDLRLMMLVKAEGVAAGDPMARPAEIVWSDRPVPASTMYLYRLTAVDLTGNESAPSSTVGARAYRAVPPQQPEWVDAVRIEQGAAPTVRLTWTLSEDLQVLVQRRVATRAVWSTVAAWLPLGTTTFDDTTADPAVAYVYRLRGRDTLGQQSEAGTSLAVPAVP